MRGRKPKPTALKLFEGNRGKRALNKREPVPDPLPPDCPDDLTDPDARGEWTATIVPAIYRRQITLADRVLAVAHCVLWATWRSQLADAAKHANIVAVNGRPTANPARTAANKTLALLIRVDSELGLTPASRTRIQVADGATGYEQATNRWAGIL